MGNEINREEYLKNGGHFLAENTEAKEYDVELVNEQGCTFDSGTFVSWEEAHKWAEGRHGTYRVIISDAEITRDWGIQYVLDEYEIHD